MTEKGTSWSDSSYMQSPLYTPLPHNFTSLHSLPQLPLYLLSWERELLAKSLDWGKLGNVATCWDAEGRSEVVVDTTLGSEPAEGSEGEGSVLDTETDEVAAMSWKETFKHQFQHIWLSRWVQKHNMQVFYLCFTEIWLIGARVSIKWSGYYYGMKEWQYSDQFLSLSSSLRIHFWFSLVHML